MKHISSLDGLRGVAVLLVVFFHYFPRECAGPLGKLSSVGWMGVDIFFVLSGFLITSILYEQRGADHYFRNFYVRRLLRLAPLYYCLFAQLLVLTPWLHIQWRPMHLALLFYAANLVLPVDSSLAVIGPFNLFHIWSLAVEEQFYLIWPWLVGGRWSRKTLQRICVAGIVIAPLLRLAMLHARVEPWWLYQSLPTRMDSLLVGALLALIPRPSRRTATLVGCTALLVFGATVWAGHSAFFLSQPIQGIGYSALALLSGSVLVLTLDPGSILSRICSWKVLRFYGKYSYGLYLWHYFFSQQFGELKVWIGRQIPSHQVAGLVSFFLILLSSTAIAMMSYRWIETPFLQLKSRFAAKPSVPGSNRQESRGGEASESKLETTPGLH